jgi:hypothetical protein
MEVIIDEQLLTVFIKQDQKPIPNTKADKKFEENLRRGSLVLATNLLR